MNKPVLHAECINIQNPNVIIPHDVVHLHVEAMSLLLKHVALRSYVLKLVGEGFCAVLQYFILQPPKHTHTHAKLHVVRGHLG